MIACSARTENLSPSALQVEAFLSILCEDTEIAELELKMGGFQLKVQSFFNMAPNICCSDMSVSE